MDKSFLGAMEAITGTIHENKEFLTDLDRAIGDADHGHNMARGFHAVMEKLRASPPADLSTGLKTTAMTLISTVGGASGPLYGTAFLRCAKVMQGKDSIDKTDAVQLLGESLDGIESRGKAQPGDKTMIDALKPAYDTFAAASEQNRTFLECLEEACKAAEEGVNYTKTIAARKGRASYLGERSIGHQDPGATSVMLILKALTEYYKSL
ncbi:dihydroxyacetone kinase subunit DhaL [Marasmitruncus massiliensis]|jgi:dihydroxyacetone kinase-like protein|uniref:dihydroxyacetone kinase subunit DhaL n=1 Tax=Marasmitruncus massiliensis TaxID=1944642 RepID=UPI000C7A103A|nr:dihydroxyacetone kinase subunit DhaL [Marasmitruncus massiliensis]MBE6906910.1 dihydroxyacetone kinase subunit L [Oscillospiraceae bacterium]